MRTAFAAALLVTLGLTSAQADTTYNYVGAPWEFFDGDGWNPAAVGTNMTGSVTYNFDTTGFTGFFSGNLGLNNPYDPPGFMDVQLTSGTLTADWKTNGIRFYNFTFSNGQIVDANIESWGVPCGSQVGAAGCSMEVGVSSYSEIVVLSSLPHVNLIAGALGTWTLDPASVPAPIMGAGLPSLILAGLGLLGWRQRKRSISAP
jgi:hypothetical protein